MSVGTFRVGRGKQTIETHISNFILSSNTIPEFYYKIIKKVQEEAKEKHCRVVISTEVEEGENLHSLISEFLKLRKYFDDKFWDYCKDLEGSNIKRKAQLGIVRALRQLFSNFGYGEEQPPKLINPDDRNSDVTLTICPYTYGNFEVVVSSNLEINVYLPYDLGRHWKEHAKIVERLREKYGIFVPIRFFVKEKEIIIPPRPPPKPRSTSISLCAYAIVPAIGIPPDGEIIGWCETRAGAEELLGMILQGAHITPFGPYDPYKKEGYYVVKYTKGLDQLGLAKETYRVDRRYSPSRHYFKAH